MVFTRGSIMSFLLGLLLHASRDLGAVRVEDVGPEPLQVPPQLVQTVAPHRVHAAVAARLDAHEVRLLEHLQVLRHGGPAHWLAFPQLTHRFWLLPQRLQDVPAGGGFPRGENLFRSPLFSRMVNYNNSKPRALD